MSILRFDQTTSDWVIVAPSRVRRPDEFRNRVNVVDTTPDSATNCPFCPGNEARTPQEIYAERAFGSSASEWTVRVIPNKFPALRIEEDHRHYDDGEGFRYIGGCGAHEVIVESPDHSRLLAEQPVDQIERVLRTAQMRYQDLMRDTRFQTVIIFKNHGESAGTSLRHPHWQLIATPVVPRLLRLKHIVATEFFDQTGSCLYCVMVQHELAEKKRILAANSDFVALLPYASHVPFETWILPLHHQSSFGLLERDRLRPLAEMLKIVLLRLHRGLENPDFNLAIDTVSRGDESKEYFLWHIRVLPRLTTPAGFELGSGMSINTVRPEEAAEYLRGVEA
ncbi:MAG: galactose-1-phosphate uridylyltransferase [Planctomycetia bacterium]|nr:galactose-1-phosphate uridylyltransferase [Planctomycetia bacterium]